MARLTDDEIGELLRETFTEKEELTDRLPEATTRRRTGPILLAAAAVLIVVAGALYGVHRLTSPAPEPPAAAKSLTDTDIWVGAIEAGAQRFAPKDGWKELVLRPSSVAGPQESANRAELSDPVQRAIAARLSETVPAHWDGPGTVYTTTSCRLTGVAQIGVGDLVDTGDEVEVRMTITYACGSWYVVTYRVDRSGAGSILEVTGRPAFTTCATPGGTPASPRAGC